MVLLQKLFWPCRTHERITVPGVHLEKAMATHSSTLAWKIPGAEEPGRLQSMGSLRVRHDWATSLSVSLSCTGEGNGNPLQCSCLENLRDGGAWWAAVYGVAQNWTRLKWLSSSSSSTHSWGFWQRHWEVLQSRNMLVWPGSRNFPGKPCLTAYFPM